MTCFLTSSPIITGTYLLDPANRFLDRLRDVFPHPCHALFLAAYPDSFGRRFYALVDGSYLLIREGKEELWGEAHLIEDGRRTQISALGDVFPLSL